MSLKSILKTSLVGDVLIRRTPILYRRSQAFLARMEVAALDERRAAREAMTARTLRLASQTDYAKSRAFAGGYESWPLLEKDTLRDQAAALNRKVLLPVYRAETGGSTGVPVALTRSWQSVVFEQAAHDHLFARHGCIEWRSARIAVLRGDTVKPLSDMTPPFWKLQHNGKALAMSAHHLSAVTAGAYVEALKKFRPQALWVYPSALEALVWLTSAEPLSIEGLKLVFSSSEVLTPEAARQSEAKFGVPVLDYYGQAERVALSYSLNGRGHFFMAGYGRVELSHDHDEEDESLYEVIGTSYWNDAEPLVRFRTGDLARLPKGLGPEEIDEICLGLRPFLGIAGRTGEYLLAPDGARLIGLNHLPRGVPDVVQMQIDQTAPDRVEIRVVPLPGFSEATRALILDKARQKIPPPMAVEIVAVERLQRTERGKAPLVRRSFQQ